MRTKKTVLNLITALTGQLISVLASVVTRIIFTRYLSQEYLGLSGLFSNILTMLSLVELGVGPAITFALYKPLADKDIETVKSLMRLYKSAYRIIGILVLLFGLVFLPLYPFFIKDEGSIPNLDIIYCLYVLNTGISYFYSYKITLITADQNQYVRNIGHYAAYVLMNIFQIILLITTKKYLLYLICQVIFTFAENAALSVVADKMYPYLKEKDILPMTKEEKKPIVRNVKAMMFHKIGSLVVGSTDNLLISKFLGLAVSGLYSNYALVLNAVNNILAKVFDSVVASVGNLNAEEKTEKIYLVYHRLFFLAFCLYGLCATCISCLIQPFILFAFGENYLLDDFTVLALSVNFFVTGMRHAPNVMRSAAGLYYRDWAKPIAESIVNLVVSIILLKYLGVAGIFLGTIASTVFVSAWIEALIVYKDVLNKPFYCYFRDYFKYALFTALTAFAIYRINGLILTAGIAGLFLKAIVASTLFIIAVIVVFHKDSDYIYFKDFLIDKFSSFYDVFNNK